LFFKLKFIKKNTPVFRFYTKYKFLFFSKNNLKFFKKLNYKKGYSFGTKNIKNTCNSNFVKLFFKFNNNDCNLYFYSFTVSVIIGLKLNMKKQFSIIKNKFNFFFIIPKIQFVYPGQFVYHTYLKQLYLLLIINGISI